MNKNPVKIYYKNDLEEASEFLDLDIDKFGEEESIWKEAALFDFNDLSDEIQKGITPKKIEPIEPIKVPEEKPKKQDFFGDLGKNIQENINKDLDLESSPVVPQVLFKSQKIKPKKTEPEIVIEEPAEEPLEKPKRVPTKKKITKLKEEEIRKTPELFTLNEFVPFVMDQNEFYNEEKSQNIDSSLTSLEYLYSIGYKYAVWQLGPEYKEDNCHTVEGTPICDLRNGLMFDIKFIINNAHSFAASKGFSPPKAITSLSHVGCRCSLLCLKPDKPSQIPDSAPGIPLFAGDRKIINKFKKNLLSKLQNINVDRWSLMLPAELENLEQMNQENSHLYTILQNPEQNKYSYYMTERIAKKEEDEGWIEDIRPIQITENFIYNPLFRIIRPVSNSYIGFQLEKTNDKAKVYLSNLGYEIQVPKNIVNYLELDPIDKEIDANSFIETEDGELGIVLKAKEYEEPICYLPSFRSSMKLDGPIKNLNIRGIS